MKNGKKKYVLLFFVFLLLSVAYAVLSSNLSISNILNIGQASFNVSFDLIEITDTTLENPTYSLNFNKNQITFNADFDKPGDFVDYSFHVINNGTIDAELKNFSISGIDNSEVIYSLKYYNGKDLSEGDLLRIGTNKRIIFHLEYKYDINELADIPNINATVTLNYKQSKSIDEKTWDYEYKDELQTFVASKNGKYKIEVWGAQGGTVTYNKYNLDQGYGGYSVGTVNLEKDEKIYLAVGGAGKGGELIKLPATYNGGGSSSATNKYGSFASSGGGGSSVYLSDDVKFNYGKELLAPYTDGDGGTYTDEQVYVVGNSAVFKYPNNFNVCIGSLKNVPVVSYYKVEWRGENLDDSKIVYDGGYYPIDSSYFTRNGGVEVYASRITSTVAEIYYKVNVENSRVEFRLETNGAFLTIHSKSVIRIDDPLIVAGGGGGAHFHWNGISYAGSGGGYIGGSPVDIFEHFPDSCSPGGGGTQSQGGEIGNGFTAYGQNGNKGVGGNYNSIYGAGGGGGFYGGSSGLNGDACAYSGAGGSGYIANSRLSNKEMYCFNCATSADPSIKTSTTSNVSETPTSRYAKKGEGHIRITYLG